MCRCVDAEVERTARHSTRNADGLRRASEEAQPRCGVTLGSSAFGAGGEGFLRLCFAASAATLRTGVERLVAALA